MLGERIQNQIPNIIIIQVNTDGITSIFDKKYDELYDNICKEWESETKLILEHAYYTKFVMRDVNNYASLYDNGKIKYKGVFEIDKVVGNEPAYHKDNSFKIVPIAISNYFFKGISIEETITNHNNIYDFCGRQKFNRYSHGETHEIINSELVITQQQKNVRYYISKSNKIFIKQYTKGTTEIINKGFQVEIFNKFIDKDIKEYNINYNYYIQEANKIINIINNKQMSLF